MDVDINLTDLNANNAAVGRESSSRADRILKVAEVKYTENTEKIEHCMKCDVLFQNWNDYFMHKLSDPGAHMCCYFCGKDFRTTAGTVRHQRQDHAAEQSLTCVGCNTCFNRAGAYVSHIENKQCPVIHKTDFDQMRGDKKDHHGSKLLATYDDKSVSLNPGPVQGSWETWPGGRVDPDMPIFNDKDFPVLTAEKHGCSDVSNALTRISNNLGLKEGAKKLTTAIPKQAPPKKYHPLDPRNPDFNVKKCFNPYIGIWVCPWAGCKKTKKTEGSLVQHLKSHAEANTEVLRCPSCLAIFRSATALVQHAESQAIRCNIRESFQYRQAIDQMTGGLVDIDPLDERHFDDTIKYTSGKVVTSVGGHTTIADASAAYWAEQEERRQKQIKEMELTAKW